MGPQVEDLNLPTDVIIVKFTFQNGYQNQLCFFFQKEDKKGKQKKKRREWDQHPIDTRAHDMPETFMTLKVVPRVA